MRFPGKRSLFGRPGRPPFLAVDNVDLELRQGETFGLVGPNGAGKTTLIKMLTTLLTPTEGRVTIGGLDIVRDAFEVRSSVGLVTSNERSFYWRLTARQNLEFFASLYNLPQREVRSWIDELFELLKLEDRADDRFDSYSTGMKQRLAFARGLLCKPKFLFMDEPTKGVDPVSRADLDSILRERIIERWRPTVLITSHDLGEIERLCDRVAVMNHGRFMASGTVEELRAQAGAMDSFKLRVRGLTAEQLQALAAASGALPGAQVQESERAVELRVQFPQGAEDFPRLVKGIVELGGDVLTCTLVQQSFDDVFQSLVRNEAKRVAESEEARSA